MLSRCRHKQHSVRTQVGGNAAIGGDSNGVKDNFQEYLEQL